MTHCTPAARPPANPRSIVERAVSPRRGERWLEVRRGGELVGVLVAVLSFGCAAETNAVKTGPVTPPVYSFEPSPLLQLARSERELPPLRLAPRPRANEPEPAPRDTTLDEDGIQREVRVRRTRFATPEDLARAVLRHAESRRPRELHPTRYLIRATRVHAATRAAKRRARRMVDARDPDVARCLTEDLSSHPSVILRAPSALVLEEARRTGAGPTDHAVTVQFRGQRPPAVTTEPPVHDAATACLVSALTPGPGDRLRSARVELSAFAQGAYGHGGDALHQRLANEAATLGWIELERGAHAEALSFFEDAYWLYHRAEYELLQAMALHEMGKVEMALTRYRSFLEARPHAPEVATVRERIAAIEADARASHAASDVPKDRLREVPTG